MARRVHIIFNPAAGWRRRLRLDRVVRRLGELGAPVTSVRDARPRRRRIDRARHRRGGMRRGRGGGRRRHDQRGDERARRQGSAARHRAARHRERARGRDRPAARSRRGRRGIAHGRPMPIYCGSVNGRRFAMMVGIGFDARVVEGSISRLKRSSRQGRLCRERDGRAGAACAPAAIGVEIDGAAHDAARRGDRQGPLLRRPLHRRGAGAARRAAAAGGTLRRGGARRRAALCPRARVEPHRDSLRDVRVLPAREVRVTGPAGEAVQMMATSR